METKSFDEFNKAIKDNVTLKIKVKAVRSTLKRCPLCNVKHYEPTNVCKLCKEKH